MYKLVRGLAAFFACSWISSASAAPTVAVGAPAKSSSTGTALSAAYAAHGGELESLLLREDDAGSGQRLTGVTRLGDGTRLWEEARFDAAGKLTRAESMCACASGSSERIVFDAISGMVELRSTQGARRWSVPTDHPWIWVARGCGTAAQKRSLATPVSALVAMRAATEDGVRRLIDMPSFTSHTITADQVVVPDAPGSAWVVLGDDAVLIRNGLPQRWRANALGVDVEQR